MKYNTDNADLCSGGFKRMSAIWLLLTALIIFPELLAAGQSAAFTGTQTGNFTIPSVSPYTTLGSTRLEMRIHDWTTPTTTRVFFTSPGFSLELRSSGEVCAQNRLDALNDYGSFMCADVTGRSDVIVRVQRNVTDKIFQFEVASVQGDWRAVTYCGSKLVGNTQSNRFPCPIRTIYTGSWAGNGSIGGSPGATVQIAWIKWYSTLVASNSKLAAAYDGADLADWRLDGSGADVNGLITISVGSIPFSATPLFPPLARPSTMGAPEWSEWLSVRAGHPAQLSAEKSVSFTDNPPTEYYWEQLEGPTTLIFDNQASATPVIRGAVFGTYVVKLTVTDDAGQKGEATLQFGAVAMTDEGVVVYGDPNVEKIFGPMIAFGKNPWPWADSRHKYLSEFFGEKLTTDPDYEDVWNKPLPGTINVINGSTTVTGVGTTFQQSLVCDGTGRFLIHYPRSTGGFGRFLFNISSCPSDTTLILSSPYNLTASANGLNYSLYPSNVEGAYANGGNNINYYDNILAHYALYFRSGNTKYRDYARTLAYRWWTSPLIDRRFTGVLPRLASPIGLVACVVVDDCTTRYPVFETFWQDYEESIESADIFVKEDRWPGGDIREEGYRALIHVLAALFDPNPAKAARYTNDVNQGLAAKWLPRRQVNGTFFPPKDIAGIRDEVMVENGSTIVTAINGTQFASNVCTATSYIPLAWFSESATQFDRTAYPCTFVNATTLKLATPYAGTSGSKKILISNIVGVGTQPFTLGVPATYLRYHYLINQSPQIANALIGVTDWLMNYGFNPRNKGLFYGREFAGCEPPSKYVNCENGGYDVQDGGARFYAAEPMASWAWTYQIAPLQSRKDRGDLHYAGIFGKLGGPMAGDGYFYNEFENDGFVVTQRKSKDFGFAFGFGFASTWPAVRLGAPAPEKLVSSTLSVDMSRFPQGTSMRVTVTQPSGAKSVFTCAESPCQVTLDARQGAHWARIEFLDSSSQLIPDAVMDQLIDLP
jgi:hypothetical protein